MSDIPKIVITTELQADEKASAQRIAAQLPSIAQKINALSSIKVGVTLDESTIKSQAQRVSQQMETAMKSHSVGVTMNIDLDAIQHLQSQLNNLHVDKDITSDLTEQLNNMGIHIDKIRANWVEVNAEEGEAEASMTRLLQLTIQGTDQHERNVTQIAQYNTETQKLETTQTSVTANLKQQEQIQQRLEQQAKADNESRLQYLARQQIAVEKLVAKYQGNSTGYGVTDENNLRVLNEGYETINTMMERMRTTNGKLSAEQKIALETAISHLSELTIQYEKAERAQTKLQAKPIEVIKTEQTSNLNTFIAQMENAGMYTDELRTRIDALRSSLSGVTERNGIQQWIYDFAQLKAEMQTIQTQTTGLNTFEASLEKSGMLTEELRKQINTLRTSLANISGAGDSAKLTEGFTKWTEDFAKVKADAQVVQTKIAEINAKYTELAASQKVITDLQMEMLNVSSTSEEYDALNKKLVEQQGYYSKISSEVDVIAAQYPQLLAYSQGYQEYLRLSAEYSMQLAVEQGRVSDAAASVNVAMNSVGTSVELVESKFRGLSAPTTELTEKVQSLRALMAAVGDASTDQDKVAAYEKLRTAIQECNTEISNLTRLQRLDIGDTTLTAKLEKAKTDLTVIGQKWSALRNDQGLNAQFIQLEANLAKVNNQMELTKWNAQFAAFKSQVKAAGKDVQSLGDKMKSLLSNAMQWVSAYYVIYRVFALMKDGVNTVIDLDTAMIDLRKTTDETEATYQAFYETANETAKALGVTTEEIISQTAEWSRLGYSMQEAAEMAENSAIFSAISPELETEEATDGLISIMKAYGYEAEEMLDGVISKINKIGNEMAVSNADVVEVMTKSSSAMAAANNTFEETVALATAAVEITRDSASVGTGLKTNFCLCVQKCA